LLRGALVVGAVAVAGCVPPPSTSNPSPPPGPVSAGCGLSGAAFCEDFEGPRNTTGNRNGDLSVSNFSAARWHPDLSPEPDHVGPAQIPACRSGSVPNPLPPADTLVCDPSSAIQSHYALVSTAAQNYGDNSYRISQQFDIANRTGTIDFDASLFIQGALMGWPTLAFTADPYSAPSYLADNSGGATPREGVQIHFNSVCPGSSGWTAFPKVRTYRQYAETLLHDENGFESWCTSNVTTAAGHLNHVQIHLSQSHIEIMMSDASSDGVHYGPLKKVFSAPLSLAFTRGYVYFGVHNHATLKYGNLPSWTVQWDNIAFDGPRLAAARVSQVSDAAVPSGGGLNLAYPLPNSASGGSTPPLSLGGVSTSNVSSAKLVFDVFADQISNTNWSAWRFNYRLNGGAWHAAALSAAEIALFPRAHSYALSLTVDPQELVAGTNSVQFSGTGFYAGYQPFVGNVDLIVQ
jgi:hypothetical protein